MLDDGRISLKPRKVDELMSIVGSIGSTSSTESIARVERAMNLAMSTGAYESTPPM
jgi:hypothetical protein